MEKLTGLDSTKTTIELIDKIKREGKPFCRSDSDGLISGWKLGEQILIDSFTPCSHSTSKGKLINVPTELFPQVAELVSNHEKIPKMVRAMSEVAKRFPNPLTNDRPYPKLVERRTFQLEKSLSDLLEHYVSLIESGDAGNWNPEEEQVVINARAVLSENTYYCECSEGCGNSYKISKIGETCAECNKGTMQPQDVEPWE